MRAQITLDGIRIPCATNVLMILKPKIGDRVCTNADWLRTGGAYAKRWRAGAVVGGSLSPNCVTVLWDGNKPSSRSSISIGFLDSMEPVVIDVSGASHLATAIQESHGGVESETRAKEDGGGHKLARQVVDDASTEQSPTNTQNVDAGCSSSLVAS